jgi:hypothetical protein
MIFVVHRVFGIIRRMGGHSPANGEFAMNLTRKSGRITPVLRAMALAMAICFFPCRANAAEPTPTLGSTQAGAGIPRDNSPNIKGTSYMLQIFYFDNMGNLQKSNVTVPITKTAGLPNPTAAQLAAASAAKADAIVKAINAANLNGVMAMLQMMTRQATFNGVTFQQTWYTINGVRQSVQNYPTPKPGGPKTYLGSPFYKLRPDPTFESGDSQNNFMPGGSSSPGSMFQGMLNGSGGTATGMDVNNNPSVVGFGFIDYSSLTAPVYYTANFNPTVGMTDDQVLGGLASVFNTDYASSGFTATYDPTSDSLSIDQLLPNNDALWQDNSDTGLFYSMSLNTVPEPASASTILAVIAIGLLARKRCWERETALTRRATKTHIESD